MIYQIINVIVFGLCVALCMGMVWQRDRESYGEPITFSDLLLRLAVWLFITWCTLVGAIYNIYHLFNWGP